MAKHDVIDLSKKQLSDYVFLETYSKWREFADFLDQLNLRPYCDQQREKYYTCWYVGFKDVQKPYVLHFNITLTGLMVWFRRPQFLSKLGQEKTKPVVNYRYMPIHDFDETEQKIVFDYVKAIDGPLHEGKVALDKTDKHKKCEVKFKGSTGASAT